MPATRSILSVIRLMLEANLPQPEILRTLNACLAALPPCDRHPLDQAPAVAPVPMFGDSGDRPTADPGAIKWIDQKRP